MPTFAAMVTRHWQSSFACSTCEPKRDRDCNRSHHPTQCLSEGFWAGKEMLPVGYLKGFLNKNWVYLRGSESLVSSLSTQNSTVQQAGERGMLRKKHRCLCEQRKKEWLCKRKQVAASDAVLAWTLAKSCRFEWQGLRFRLSDPS